MVIMWFRLLSLTAKSGLNNEIHSKQITRSLKLRHVDIRQYLHGRPPGKAGRCEPGSVRRIYGVVQ